jgi:hypothetical protein
MKSTATSSVLIYVFLLFVMQCSAQADGSASVLDSGSVLRASVEADPSASEGGAAKPVVPALGVAPAILPASSAIKPTPPDDSAKGVSWGQLYRSSGRFLAFEHTFRLLTEPGTREGLKGSFLHNYADAVSNLHGWADGDEFYVNYVGHSMQGAVAGYLWAQNDRAYRHAEFGANRLYWKSRLRAAAFTWVYSTQFEIGPVSEASIGGIQKQFPQQGFVDHVITPSIGMAWMVGEDVIDRYIIKRIEAATTNRWARLLSRGVMNPARSFSNFLNGSSPWSRTSRPGVLSYDAIEANRYASARKAEGRPAPADFPDAGLAPPFEFAMTFQPETYLGGGHNGPCLGGGANAGFRVAPSWQLVAELGGCKMTGLEQNLSGDSLTYTVGPRWLGRIHGPWSAHLQVLVGGNKITQERMYPQLKRVLDAAAARNNQEPPSHDEYTDKTESNGFAVATGAGLNYKLNRALTIRVAEFSYRHSCTSPLWGRSYSDSLKLTSGLVLHMGTW